LLHVIGYFVYVYVLDFLMNSSAVGNTISSGSNGGGGVGVSGSSGGGGGVVEFNECYVT
jgi:uncharacterized membrane protein